MAFWDDLMNGLGIENGAKNVNDTIASTNVGQARGEGGSFDLNRVRGVIPAGMDEEAQLIARMTDARLDAVRRTMKEPTRSPVQFLGDALSAASVPVAYAQGNTAYGTKMAGNTTADAFNTRRNNYRDSLVDAEMKAITGGYDQLGESALKYMGDRRTKAAEARKTLGQILAAGRTKDGINPRAAQAAETWAIANGFKQEWDEIKQALSIGAPVAPEAQAPPQAPPQAPGFTPDMGATQPSQAPAPAAMPPSQGGPGLTALAGLGGKLPQQPAAGPAPATPSVPTELPPHIVSMHEEASIAAAMGDDVRAKSIMQQADVLSDVWKKQQESRFSRTNVSNSTLIYGFDEQGNPVVMQPSSEGRLIRSEVPAGVRVLGPDGKAGKIQMGKDFAKRYDEYQDSAANALDTLAILGMGEEALATGVYTGLGAGAIQGFRNMAVSLGVADAETINKVAGGELLQGIQNRMALLMRGGGQMPGALSNQDIIFLQQAQFGMDKTPEANRRMIAAFKKLNQRKLDVARMADEYVAANGQIDAKFAMQLKAWAEQNHMFGDGAGGGPGAPAPAERKFKVLR